MNGPDGTLHHHKGIDHDYRGTDPPVLFRFSIITLSRIKHWKSNISYLHLSNPVTGVEISTLPASISGNVGNAAARSNRTAAADPNRRAFSLCTRSFSIQNMY